MAGVSRFDCYPSDFLNGIIGLNADQISAYTVLMMLQYDRGSPVQYTGREHELAVRTGLPKGRLAKAIGELVSLGKLQMTPEGEVVNSRSSKELEKISQRILKNSENSRSGGNATKKKWEQIRNENSDTEGRPASQSDSQNIAPRGPPSSLPPSPPEEAIESKKEDSIGGAKRPAREKDRTKKPRSTIAADWRPDDHDQQAAKAMGLTSEQFRTEWPKFRDYHRAHGSLMADWRAAWRTWLGNVAQFQRNSSVPPPSRYMQTC